MALTAAEKQKAYRLRQSQAVIDHVTQQDAPFLEMAAPLGWEQDPRTVALHAELEAAHAEIAMLKRHLAEKPKAPTPPIAGSCALAGAVAISSGLVSQSTVKLMTMLEMRQMRQAEMLKSK